MDQRDIYVCIHTIYQKRLEHSGCMIDVCQMNKPGFLGCSEAPQGYAKWHQILSSSLMSCRFQILIMDRTPGKVRWASGPGT